MYKKYKNEVGDSRNMPKGKGVFDLGYYSTFTLIRIRL
jgi:hypothetical protein